MHKDVTGEYKKFCELADELTKDIECAQCKEKEKEKHIQRMLILVDQFSNKIEEDSIEEDSEV